MDKLIIKINGVYEVYPSAAVKLLSSVEKFERKANAGTRGGGDNKIKLIGYEKGSFASIFQDALLYLADHPELPISAGSLLVAILSYVKNRTAGAAHSGSGKRIIIKGNGSVVTVPSDGYDEIVIKGKGNEIVLPGSSVQALTDPALTLLNAITKEPDSTGISVENTAENKVVSSITISKKEIEEILSYDVPMQTIRVKETLRLVKPVLKGNSKWSFLRGGKTIDVSVEDKDWLSRVQENPRETLSNIDIEVKLRIENRTDLNGNTVPGSEKYYAEKIMEK